MRRIFCLFEYHQWQILEPGREKFGRFKVLLWCWACHKFTVKETKI